MTEHVFARCLKWVDTKVRHFSTAVLKEGPVPRHMAFIMDGNRRFANERGAHAGFGHYKGFEKLEEILEWCLELGVSTVTVYAFSLENFKRPQEEVSLLMNLARDKLNVLCEKSDVVKTYGVRIKVLGNLSLLREDVRDAALRAERLTKDNNRALLNICSPYTAREDITFAIRSIAKGVADGDIELSDASVYLLENCLRTHGSPQVDMLLRTSGEIRLSDFLLWQTCETSTIHFLKVYWPSLSIWHLIPLILSYQLHHDAKKGHRIQQEDHNGAPRRCMDEKQTICRERLDDRGTLGSEQLKSQERVRIFLEKRDAREGE